MATTKLYLLECKSNMHVGSGDSNYGVIDKQVQRDVTDDLPCIYASSLKGAFREYFDKNVGKIETNSIFGEGENKGSKGMEKGSHVFDQAMLFSFPVRSNKRPFFHATAPMVAGKILERIKLSDINEEGAGQKLQDALNVLKQMKVENNRPVVTGSDIKDLFVEDFESFVSNEQDDLSGLYPYLGSSFVILSDSDFIEITNNYHLPVIARNKLDNGESKNLWYEQVLPRETRFTFFVDYIPKPGNPGLEDSFDDNIKGKLVQIGGGSSIGYGYTKVENIGF